MDIKSSEGRKTRRKKIRAAKKDLILKEKENKPCEPYIAEGFENFFCFFTTFDFPSVCRNIKHDISKTKQAKILKFSENVLTFIGPT